MEHCPATTRPQCAEPGHTVLTERRVRVRAGKVPSIKVLVIGCRWGDVGQAETCPALVCILPSGLCALLS